MKQAAATLDNTSHAPHEALGLDAAKAERSLRARPMVRATGAVAAGERLRPRRLRAAEVPLPSASRLVYRAGAIVMR